MQKFRTSMRSRRRIAFGTIFRGAETETTQEDAMWDPRRIYHSSQTDAAIFKAREELRRAKEKAADVLKRPKPDSFLGRKTQEPFPKDSENHWFYRR